MSRIYSIIESQVDNIVTMIMTNEAGQIEWSFWNQYISSKYIRFAITLLASFIYLMLIGMVGLYAYNYGLFPIMPNVLRPIGKGPIPEQSSNPYYQLFLTVFAIFLFM